VRSVAMLLLFFVSFYNSGKSQSISIWKTFLILNTNNAGNDYFDLLANTALYDFDGQFLGTYSNTQSIVIAGGESHTNKCSGGDVFGSTLYYRVYLTTGTPGSFTPISLGFKSNDGGNCGGDQTWDKTNNTTNILTGLPNGTYYLEVYSDATGNQPTVYASNNGANYKATFVITNAVATLFSNINAIRINNDQVKIAWQVQNEANIDHYEIEHSLNGSQFSSVKMVDKSANIGATGTYNTLDLASSNTTHFYRIKALGLNGNAQYSAIAKVNPIQSSSIKIYPNPAVGNTVQVYFDNAISQIYQVKLINAAGQVVYTNRWSIRSGQNQQALQPNVALQPGVYALQLTNAQGENRVVKVVVR
jgi:hypothetical protein